MSNTKGLFNAFQTKSSAKGGSRESYSLNEILAIIHMSAVAGLDKATIAQLTGRSKDSLNYKIFEGKVTINGKTQVRSIRKYFYADPKSLTNNDQVDWETAVKALFADHGAEYKGEEDVEARIEEYKATLGDVMMDDVETAV